MGLADSRWAAFPAQPVFNERIAKMGIELPINVVAVVGAGAMGRGIAQVMALAGYPTALYDSESTVVHAARESINAMLAKGVEKGKLTVEESTAALGRLRIETDLADTLMDADLVVEAVPEDIELKRDLFGEFDARCPTETVLASNTSSLSIAAIADATARPDRVVGLHFFNPVPIMQLVELVVLPETDSIVVAGLTEVVERLGKTAIVVNNSPGFATSRLGVALGLEAIRMLQEGVASAADIDTAMELGYNHPMGPLKLTDLIGLDVRLAIAEHLAEELGSERFEPPELLRDLVAKGKLGRKTGIGFYDWTGEEPVAE